MRLLAATCILAIAIPATAGATTAPRRQMMIDLGSHDGFRTRAYVTDRTITLEVVRDEHSRHAGAGDYYYTRAHLAGHRIEGDFGPLGAVTMRFRPSRASAGDPRPGSCDGRYRLSTSPGTFVGSWRFRGEGGYVSIDVSRAKGSLEIFSPSAHCQAEAGREKARKARQGPKVTYLGAYFRQGLDAVYFSARNDREGKASYFATDESGGDQFGISRYAYVEASPLTFATDDALRFASISPPYPFGGSGLIERNPDGSRAWTGSLSVSFPGAPDVALTGAQFKTQLLRQW
jgi:hypothetical protein